METAFLTLLWNDILQRISKSSETLQKEELDLLGATKELKTLERFLLTKREGEAYEEYERAAVELCGQQTATYGRTRKRKLLADDSRGVESDMDPRTKFRTGIFLPIIDSLISQLNKRRQCYETLSSRFEIFSNFVTKETDDLTEQAERLAQSYPQDIDGSSFVNECLHFQSYMKLEDINKQRQFYSYIKTNHLESTFPNLEVALRVYLTLPVTNCTAERSFSALKRVKSERRSTMEEEKLNSLMLLCTEQDITMRLDFNDMIDKFARSKLRKKPLV